MTTADQRETIKIMRRLPVVQGETRSIFLCPDCGVVQAHDFIPYSIGRGRWYNMCCCNAVSNEWIHRAVLKRTKRSTRVIERGDHNYKVKRVAEQEESNPIPVLFEVGATGINFDCPYAVYPKGGHSSVCYVTSDERGELIATALNHFYATAHSPEHEINKQQP